jgi:hypothetical protein
MEMSGQLHAPSHLLKGIFRPKKQGSDRMLEKIIICTLYQVMIRMIKRRRMRSPWDAACLKKIRNTYKILVRKPEETTMISLFKISSKSREFVN